MTHDERISRYLIAAQRLQAEGEDRLALMLRRMAHDCRPLPRGSRTLPPETLPGTAP